MTRHTAIWLTLSVLGACSTSETNTTTDVVANDAVVTDVVATDTGNPTPSTPSTTNVTVGGSGSLSYSPAAVTINQGDTVHWVWTDPTVPHTVTSGTPGAPDGRFCSLPAGGTPSAQACAGVGYAMTAPFTYDHLFDQAGTFPYYCTVHGALMTGTVTVTASTTTTTPTPTTPTTPTTPVTPPGGY